MEKLHARSTQGVRDTLISIYSDSVQAVIP